MSRAQELKYLFLIIVIFIAACVETDIYLPAFPDMMASFGVSEGVIQGLLTWNFIGICLSGPLYGPLSDAFGRKKPLLFALGMFFAGSLITLFAQKFDHMLWGRILQGLGSGGCFTLGTAIIFDAFQKNKAIEATNNLNTIVPIIMAAAPMVGGYLNHTYGFRSNFLTIALFVLVSLLICLFFFKETLAQENRTTFRLAAIVKDFKQALTHVAFWQLTLAISLPFAGYIAFLSGTSVLFVVEFGMSKTIFPFVQAALLGAWVLGSLFLNRALATWGIPKVKRVGLILCGLGAVLLGVAALVAPKNPYFLTSGMLAYAFGANWIIGLYFPEGMAILPHIRGIAASLLTSARLLLAALVVGLTSSFYNATVYPLVAVILGTMLIIFPALFFYEKRRSQTT